MRIRRREGPAWHRHVEQVTDGIANGVVIVDHECNIQHANAAAERIFGMTRVEMAGRRCDDPAWAIRAPDGSPLARSQLACHRALHSGEAAAGLRQVIRRPDRSEAVVLVGATPLRDETGRVIGAINCYTDITGLERSGEALRERDEYNSSLLRLYRLLGRANSYSAILDAVLSEIRVTLDYPSAWLFVMHPGNDNAFLLDAQGPAENAVRELLQSDEKFRAEFDGEQFLILPMASDPYLREIAEATHMVVVEDARTDPRTNKEIVELIGNRTIVNVPLTLAAEKLGVLSMGTYGEEGVRPPSQRQLDYLSALANHVAVAMDRVRFLGERSQVERALRESEQRYRHVFENSIDSLFLLKVTKSGRFENIEVNPAFERATGIPRGKLIGNAMEDCFPARAAERINAMCRRCVMSGRIAEEELELDLPTGIRLLHTTLVPSRDDHGRIHRVVGITRDMTEHRRTQEQLKQKDRAIRRAYVDVIAAVTGNKLILMTPEEVQEALGDPITGARAITSYKCLSDARAEVTTAIGDQFADARDVDGFIVGVCEGLTNAIKHGGGARYEVRRRNGTAQVVISDKGPGVDFTTVPKATLEAGFSTQGTLGVGFTLILEMSDRVLLSTQEGGTVLVLELCSQSSRLFPAH